MFPNYSNVFSNYYYEAVPFAHDQQQQPFSIQSQSFDLASIVSSSSKQDQDLLENTTDHDHMHPPFSHMYFPSPLEDDDVILQQQQQRQQHQQRLHQQQEKPVITTVKRSCNKDRHSKIRTARGLRDRRMRLSLDVAKKFFGLQDMLGFDQPSKTVQWLLTQAGDNISKLRGDMYGQIEKQSSFSECEVVSGTEDAATADVVDDKPRRGKPGSSSCAKNQIKKTNVRQPKKAMLNNLAKASRKKARERARERTREKMERLQAKPCNDANQEAKKMKQDDLSRLSSWSQSHDDFNSHHSSFEAVLGGDEVEEPPSIFQAPRRGDLNEIDGQDARDAANFVTTGKWSSCGTILSYLQNTSASISQQIQKCKENHGRWFIAVDLIMDFNTGRISGSFQFYRMSPKGHTGKISDL